MTQTKQPTELQEKKAEQPAGQSNSVLGSQAIINPEDNRIFLADKTPIAGVKYLDFGKVDIYIAHPDSDHVFGPDRSIIDEITVKPNDSVARIAKQLAGQDGTPKTPRG